MNSSWIIEEDAKGEKSQLFSSILDKGIHEEKNRSQSSLGLERWPGISSGSVFREMKEAPRWKGSYLC